MLNALGNVLLCRKLADCQKIFEKKRRKKINRTFVFFKLVGWLCWGLTSQSTIFQSYRDGAIASWVINQYFRGVKCLAQGHNTAAVGLEPRTSRSGVRHSTTEPPRSPSFLKFSYGWKRWTHKMASTVMAVRCIPERYNVNWNLNVFSTERFSSPPGLYLKIMRTWYDTPHDKTNKMTVRPAKTQISLGIRPVWSESSLSVWRKLGSLATHWAHSADSDQTGQMPRLIWVFAGRTVICWFCHEAAQILKKL